MTREELAAIRALVGDISAEQLRYVDCFVGGGLGVFIPSVGPCFYAITPDHAHPACSFVLAGDGETRLVAEGRSLSLPPGEVMAIDAGAVHHERPGDSAPRYIAIFVAPTRLAAERAHYPDLPPEPFAFRRFAPGRELMGLLKEYMNEAEARLPGREALLEAVGTRIIHALLRAAYHVAPPANHTGNRVEIHRVLQYIHSHAGDRLTVEDLAAVAALSPSHFSRVFRVETGCTPQSYLHRVRLEQARKRLRAGEGTIATVALDCGFATPSHFTTAFRRAYGQSPSAFLKALTQDPPD